MIDFVEDKEQLINLMLRFHFYCSQNTSDTPNKVAEIVIQNEIDCQKGMMEYYEAMAEEARKNNRLLRAIKSVKGKTFYRYLLEIIEQSEGIRGLAVIVRQPVGEFQKERYGRQIKGIWVEQWSVGMEGDSWNGHVCVPLGNDKYFKFSYSM